MIFLRDLTAQLEAEENLQQRDARLAMLFEQSEVRTVTDFNAAALTLLGRSPEHLLGSQVADLHTAASLMAVPLGLAKVDGGATLARGVIANEKLRIKK